LAKAKQALQKTQNKLAKATAKNKAYKVDIKKAKQEARKEREPICDAILMSTCRTVVEHMCNPFLCMCGAAAALGLRSMLRKTSAVAEPHIDTDCICVPAACGNKA
jgi:hypothetical protein